MAKFKCIEAGGDDLTVGRVYDGESDGAWVLIESDNAGDEWDYPARYFEPVAVESTVASAPDPRIAELEAERDSLKQQLKAEHETATGLTYTLEAMKLISPGCLDGEMGATIRRIANRLRAGEA